MGVGFKEGNLTEEGKAGREALALELFGITRVEAVATGVCLTCKAKIKRTESDEGDGSVYSDLGYEDYKVVGMCEHCVDKSRDELTKKQRMSHLLNKLDAILKHQMQ